MKIILLMIGVSILSQLFSYAFAEFEQEYDLVVRNGIYTIPYDATNAEIKKIETTFCDILIYPDVQNDGLLNITLPRGLINAQILSEDRVKDVDFFVLINGMEQDFEESSSDSLQRTLTITINQDTSEIEVIGTQDPDLPYSVSLCNDVQKETKYFKPFSPKKQVENGILPTQVICKENLEKIFKPSNNLPACVKESTVKKLILRGWNTATFPITFETDKHEYKLGEPIKITMKNVGSDALKTSSTPIGFSIYDENGNRVCTWNGVNLQVGTFSSGETLTQILDDAVGCRDLVKGGLYKIGSGLYKIKADHFYEFGLWQNYHGPVYEIHISSSLGDS